ncbi:hypothetical protein [Dactylosporangium darangshiense]|uniref:Uncharacterized protein n=1 Tax=Dactylosporangium darangshiense TaxID=579108 RepID=A0ABP8DHC6_9ACTN
MEAVTEPEEYRRGYPDDVAACRALRPAVYEAARAMRTDPDPAVGAEALGVLSACLLDAAELAQHRAEVARWLSAAGGHRPRGAGRPAPVLAAFLAGGPVIDVGDWRDRLRRKALQELAENISPPQP